MPYKITRPGKIALTKKQIALGLAALLIFAGVATFISLRNNDASRISTAPTATNEPGTEKLNLNPPTEDEKKQAEDNKEALVKQMDQEKQAPASSGEKKTVTPIIVDAGQYNETIEVRAFIPEIYEADGTCTATITNDTHTITKTTTAVQDATTTRCPTITIDRGEFATAGNWKAVVSYSSTTAQGNSSPKTFKVQ